MKNNNLPSFGKILKTSIVGGLAASGLTNQRNDKVQNNLRGMTSASDLQKSSAENSLDYLFREENVKNNLEVNLQDWLEVSEIEHGRKLPVAKEPTPKPVSAPSVGSSSDSPSLAPSVDPTLMPIILSSEPSANPSFVPSTLGPVTESPTTTPSSAPVVAPSLAPIVSTSEPSATPSNLVPTSISPTIFPSLAPISSPSETPFNPSFVPSFSYGKNETTSPTISPSSITQDNPVTKSKVVSDFNDGVAATAIATGGAAFIGTANLVATEVAAAGLGISGAFLTAPISLTIAGLSSFVSMGLAANSLSTKASYSNDNSAQPANDYALSNSSVVSSFAEVDATKTTQDSSSQGSEKISYQAIGSLGAGLVAAGFAFNARRKIRTKKSTAEGIADMLINLLPARTVEFFVDVLNKQDEEYLETVFDNNYEKLKLLLGEKAFNRMRNFFTGQNSENRSPETLENLNGDSYPVYKDIGGIEKLEIELRAAGDEQFESLKRKGLFDFRSVDSDLRDNLALALSNEQNRVANLDFNRPTSFDNLSSILPQNLDQTGARTESINGNLCVNLPSGGELENRNEGMSETGIDARKADDKFSGSKAAPKKEKKYSHPDFSDNGWDDDNCDESSPLHSQSVTSGENSPSPSIYLRHPAIAMTKAREGRERTKKNAGNAI